jgi:hypothetical protein
MVKINIITTNIFFLLSKKITIYHMPFISARRFGSMFDKHALCTLQALILFAIKFVWLPNYSARRNYTTQK